MVCQLQKTTFMVQIPFLISADMKQAESQEDDVSIEGMRILLAEDNELNMEIAEFLLTNAGAEIIRTSNGKEAVEAFAKSGVGEGQCNSDGYYDASYGWPGSYQRNTYNEQK